MSFSIKLGNFLYKNAFFLYKPIYSSFKKRQDAFEIELLNKYIQKNNTVLDIGANIGFYASIISEIVGSNGKVYCFEPDNTNYNYLQKSTSGLNNVKAINIAVGKKKEKIKIYTSKEINVDHRTYKPEEYDKEIEIDCISIDEYLIEGTKVDFIKIDIQGYEIEAFKGMTKTITNNPNVKIISEFWPYGLRQAGKSLTEFHKLLKGFEFIVYLMQNNSLIELSEEKVDKMAQLPKENYFNIFLTKKHV